MFAYQAPSVYFESRDERDRSLSPLRTDISGFVGIAARGPVHTAVKIESWTQFTTIFGSHIPQAYLAYAVEGFFANGGQTCYVVRVVDPATAQKANFLLRENCASGQGLSVSNNEQIFQIVGRYPGVLAVGVMGTGNGRFTLSLTTQDGYQEVWRNLSTDQEDPRYIVSVLSPGETGSGDENKKDAPPCPDEPEPLKVDELDPAEESVAAAARSRSVLVTVKRVKQAVGFVNRRQQDTCIRQMNCMAYGDTQLRHFGKAGLSELVDKHFCSPDKSPERWGLRQFEDIDEISLIAMPDIMPKAYSVGKTRQPIVRCHDLTAVPLPTPTKPYRPEYPRPLERQAIHRLQKSMLDQCDELKDRMAILDCWQADLSPNEIEAWRTPSETNKDLFLATSDGAYYGAFYYPWILVPDPNQLEGAVRAIPPSGYVAGMMARVDNRSGVHKPPANELLLAAKDVSVVVTDRDYGRLNKLGVNLIRCYPGRGIRVVGARTLLRRQDTWWHERGYINVRRLLIMIMESIDSQLQWAVFEANNPALWQQIERVIRGFLNRLWLHGMLDGTTADDAFTVLCNRETTPPSEIDQGRVICNIRLRPPWPAEFVIVRIGVTDGEIELLE